MNCTNIYRSFVRKIESIITLESKKAGVLRAFVVGEDSIGVSWLKNFKRYRRVYGSKMDKEFTLNDYGLWNNNLGDRWEN